MAITGSSLTRGTDIAAGATSTTASIAPTANRLILVDIFTEFTGAGAAAPTVAGASMTWTQVGTISSISNQINLTRFRALAGSPGSGTLTITHAAAQSFCGWSIHDHDGIDIGGTNGANAIVQTVLAKDETGSATTLTVTLAAFGSVNNATCAAFGWFSFSPAATATPDTGWTEMDETSSTFGSFACAIESQFKATNDTTAAVTWTSGGGLMGVSSELKAAAGGATRGLFRTPPVNGIGCGGSFFRDPLAAPQMVRRDRIYVPAWLGEAA